MCCMPVGWFPETLDNCLIFISHGCLGKESTESSQCLLGNCSSVSFLSWLSFFPQHWLYSPTLTNVACCVHCDFFAFFQFMITPWLFFPWSNTDGALQYNKCSYEYYCQCLFRNNWWGFGVMVWRSGADDEERILEDIFDAKRWSQGQGRGQKELHWGCEEWLVLY